MSESYDFTLRQFESDASSIVDRARDAARAILRTALAESERQREQAQNEGRQKGFTDGMTQGRATAERKVAEEHKTAAAAMQAAADAINAQQRDLLHQSQRELVGLSLAIAERVIRTRIEADPTIVQPIIAAAVERAGRRRRLVVRLNPVDHAALKPADTESVAYAADPAVTRGGCRVVSETSEVDAQIETQLQALREALLG